MLTIFDLDHTLFIKNASVAFGNFLYKKKRFSLLKMLILLSLYILYRLRIFSMDRLHKTIFYHLFWNQNASCFFQDVEEFLDEKLPELLDKVVFEKYQKTQGLKALLSSSPDFLVEAIAKRLKMNYFLGSYYAIDERGYFSKIGHVVNGNDKAEMTYKIAEEHSVKKEDIWAYTDSILDIALLESVGHPVAVNPDSSLRKECLGRNWMILETYSQRTSCI